MLIRYLNKEKFEWLLSDNGIYIGAASAQNDKNEGIYEIFQMSNCSERDRKIINSLSSRFVQCDSINWCRVGDIDKSIMELNRTSNYISSWSFGDSETTEMWSEYGSDSVALIVDEHFLIMAFSRFFGSAVSFYKVTYDNQKKNRVRFNEAFKVKEEKFQYEEEFRLVIDMLAYSIANGCEEFVTVYVGGVPSYENKSITISMPQQSESIIRRKNSGYVISVNLEKLIKEVRLHPNCTYENECQITGSLEAAGHYIPVKRSLLESK